MRANFGVISNTGICQIGLLIMEDECSNSSRLSTLRPTVQVPVDKNEYVRSVLCIHFTSVIEYSWLLCETQTGCRDDLIDERAAQIEHNYSRE